MKRFLLMLCFLELSSACATPLTESDPSHLAPRGSTKGKVGKIAYNPSGFDKLVEIRRNDALEQIVRVCGSNDYEKLSEETVDSKEIKGGVALIGATTARVITYKCH